MQQTESKAVEIPDDVRVDLQGKILEVSGAKGRLVKDFSHAPVSIRLEDNEIIVSAHWPKRKTSALVGTVSSHIRNMVKGVTKGFTYKLKIVYSHFPISVRTEGNKILIENFIGERNPRTAKILGATRVTVKGDDIVVQGVDVGEVSQTAANIEEATRVKRKDPRKFLDGIYVYEKLEGIVD